MADLGIRYAAALFEISEESGMLQEYQKQAQFLRDTLVGEGAVSVLTHPRISAGEKTAFLTKTYGGAIHQDLMAFLKLAVSKNREEYIVPALDKLVEMIRARGNQTTAKVVSAVPLTDSQAERLAGALARKLDKKVDLAVLVDPSQIAGLSIHVDGYFLDRTVKTMLKDLKETVSNIEGEPTNDSKTG